MGRIVGRVVPNIGILLLAALLSSGIHAQESGDIPEPQSSVIMPMATEALLLEQIQAPGHLADLITANIDATIEEKQEVLEAVRTQVGSEVDVIWSDDGIVFRFPDADEPPDPVELLIGPEEIEDLVVREVGESAVFTGTFREAAARALLLPRRRPGKRTPLWLQRRKGGLAGLHHHPGRPAAGGDLLRGSRPELCQGSGNHVLPHQCGR